MSIHFPYIGYATFPRSELSAGMKVIINTDGKDSHGLIVGGGTHGSYWKEQDAYRIEFDNGTTQYMPAKYLRATDR